MWVVIPVATYFFYFKVIRPFKSNLNHLRYTNIIHSKKTSKINTRAIIYLIYLYIVINISIIFKIRYKQFKNLIIKHLTFFLYFFQLEQPAYTIYNKISENVN